MENELVTLLGLGGSEKSIIFNIILELTLPDKGKIIIEGKDTIPLSIYKTYS